MPTNAGPLDLPASLRIGPETFGVCLAGQGLAESSAPHFAAAPSQSVSILEMANDPPPWPVVQYSDWGPEGGTAHCNKYSVQFWTASRQLEWRWPIRTGHFRAALWELSVLASSQVLALAAGGVLLHGAALVVDGQAIVVSGPSGAGKSTLCSRFPGRYLHDDIVALVPNSASPSGWCAWSQDGWRPPSAVLPEWVPLQRLALFSSDRSRTTLCHSPPADALAELAAQTYFAGGAATQSLLANLGALVTDVPIFRFSHSLADSAEHVEQVLRRTL